jgi:putative ABC transport system substrate-binding protein
MRRREFIILAGAAATIAWPAPLFAQQYRSKFRIGYLVGAGDAHTETVAEFRKEMKTLGWIEGRDVIVEFRSAEGDVHRFPSMAAELVALDVDLIVAYSTPAALAAKAASQRIPIVFAMVSDPVESGLIANLARPGGNATGWSNMLADTSGKLLELVKGAIPTANRVAVIWSPANQGKVLDFKSVQTAAGSVGVLLQSYEAPTPQDLDGALRRISKNRPDALIIFVDSVTLSHRRQIAEFAARQRLPAIYQVKEFVEAGGLMSYGVNMIRQSRRTAVYVDKILKGAKPGDLAVEQPTEFEMIINLKTAKALGLSVPASLHARADEVIE